MSNKFNAGNISDAYSSVQDNVLELITSGINDESIYGFTKEYDKANLYIYAIRLCSLIYNEQKFGNPLSWDKIIKKYNLNNITKALSCVNIDFNALLDEFCLPPIIPAAPAATTPVVYPQESVAVPLTATGTNLLWYTTATGVTGSSIAPIPSTANLGSTFYYVSQTVCTWESLRTTIEVIIQPVPPI